MILNKVLYNKVKQDAKKKFKSYPSAYASAWIVREYKKRGGKYKNTKKKSKLNQWFDEKWINVCKLPKIVPCGRNTTTNYWKDFPYCRPIKRINSNTPTTVSELSKNEIKKRCKQKKKNPKKIIK